MANFYLYWMSTALLSLLYFASAAMYLAKGDFVRKTLSDLGYSAPLLLPFMIIIKLLGPVAVLWHVNAALSDLAYAGMLYHLMLSGMAHIGARKPMGAAPAVLGLVFLIVSFAMQNAAREPLSPYAPNTALIHPTLK